MKLLDPFSGYRLAYGNPLLHIGFYIAILTLPDEDSCTEGSYSGVKSALLTSHIFVFVTSIVTYCMVNIVKANQTVVSTTLDTISLLLYQGSIFFA